MRQRAWLIIALTVTMMVWTTALPAVAHPLRPAQRRAVPWHFVAIATGYHDARTAGTRLR